MGKGKYGKKNEVKIDPLKYNICLLGESKIGKSLAVSEPILTNDGWIPMGDIKEGMQVFGDDGELHNVTGVFPQGELDVYQVTFRDGTTVRCSKDHLWTVSTKKQRENMRKYGDFRCKVLTLEEIMEDYRTESTSLKSGKYKYKYSIPIVQPINFHSTESLLVDPYLLGLLMGDGGFTTSSVSFTNAEDDVIKDFLDSVHKFYHQTATAFERDGCVQYRVINNGTGNPLKDDLTSLDLYGCGSREKFIPKQYLYHTIENRRALLSGLINTDGHVVGDGTRIEYTTSSLQMAKDVAELVRGLGYCSRICTYERNDKTCQKYDEIIDYKVSIIGNDYSQLHLSEKHRARLSTKEIEYVKSITDIQLVGREECQCISVDSPNKLYVTNDYVLTHNTTIIKNMLEILGGDESYMFLEMAGEAGADAISGIIYEDCDSWGEVEDIIEDIEDNKTTDYPDLRAMVVDTYDGWIKLAEEEAIRLWNKDHPDKRADSIDASWNGFQRGQQKAFELMFDIMCRLRKVGVSTIVIGHVKNREQTDIATGMTYKTLTSDVEKIYFNLLKKKMHFLGLAYYDRKIITEKTGKKNIVTKKEETVNKMVEETRKITFRDDNMALDSGSRFADIVPEITFDPNELIKAMKDAIAAEANKGSKSVEDLTKEQEKADKEKVKELAKEEVINKEKKELEKIISTITDFIKENKSNIDLVKPLVAKSKELGFANPTQIDNIKDAKAVAKLIG